MNKGEKEIYKIPTLNFDTKKLKKYSKRISEMNDELEEILKGNSLIYKIKMFIKKKRGRL